MLPLLLFRLGLVALALAPTRGDFNVFVDSSEDEMAIGDFALPLTCGLPLVGVLVPLPVLMWAPNEVAGGECGVSFP